MDYSDCACSELRNLQSPGLSKVMHAANLPLTTIGLESDFATPHLHPAHAERPSLQQS
jgi:hypothetical protein